MNLTSKQAQWVADVRAHPGSMTQRRRSAVESWPGGMEELVRAAKLAGVHLVQVTDDRGDKLIAASIHPFDVLS